MRTTKEINQAAAILRKKGERLSIIQAEVLEKRLNEKAVFERYVVCVPAKEKDEATFFAARDAARYLDGGITLEELIPDAEKYPVKEMDTVIIHRDLIKTLIEKIDSLERKIDALSGIQPIKKTYTTQADYSKGDYMTQEKAFQYIGCSKVTLKSWTDKGLVKGYRKGAHVYYSKSELDANPTVQNFKNIKP